MSGAKDFDPSSGVAQAIAEDEAVSVASETAACAAHAATPARFEAQAFQPRLFLSNGHLQTIAGNFLSRANALPPPVPELVEVSPASGSQIASSVLCECHWHPAAVRAKRPTVILVHGLEGSSESQYVVGNANKMWRAGANIIRLNMRNCGDTERLSPTLYHSGLSSDVGAVLRRFIAREGLESVALAGYSMGGNLVLKLAGELGADAPRELHSVVAVSPSIDLGPTADALHRRANRLYERCFLRSLIPDGSRVSARCASTTTASRRSTPASLPRTTTTSARPRHASWTASVCRRWCCTRSTIPLSPSRGRRWPRSMRTHASR
jgi:predicted alpha/beta-fold hydrolase